MLATYKDLSKIWLLRFHYDQLVVPKTNSEKFVNFLTRNNCPNLDKFDWSLNVTIQRPGAGANWEAF